MKIIVTVVTHKRSVITIETVRSLKCKQTFPVEEVIIIGDSYEDRLAAQVTGSVFLEYENQPLGAKLQAGVNKAREFSPDVLLLCGSDSWLSKEWCKEGIEVLNSSDCTGSSTWYSCQALPRIQAVVTEWEYPKGMIVGSGRMILGELLNKMDWQLYPVDKHKGLDSYSDRILQEAGARLSCMSDLAKIMEVKGPWGKMHPLPYIFEGGSVERSRNKIRGNDLHIWLEENFPGSVWSLHQAVDHFRL